ncbi:MAG: hypothetical protein EKK55_02375 [Rhodocyclaceae bacterium]|nr:MAG: hypothetical protein EKK55_02375 [Rhodocyclaceae bacterium]
MKPGSIVVGPCMWPGCDGTAYVHARGVQPRGLYFCDAHRTKARDHGTYKRACVPPAEPGALCVRGCGRPQAAIQPAKYDSVPAALRACCSKCRHHGMAYAAGRAAAFVARALPRGRRPSARRAAA